MTPLTRAMQSLYPTLNFADLDGTLANVRYDEPLPAGFVPPTQAEIDAAIAKLDQVTVITNVQLKRMLDDTQHLAIAQQLVAAKVGLTAELWNSATTFSITDPLLTALALSPSPQGLGMTQDKLQAFFNAASKL